MAKKIDSIIIYALHSRFASLGFVIFGICLAADTHFTPSEAQCLSSPRQSELAWPDVLQCLRPICALDPHVLQRLDALRGFCH